jgi:hypothetical protein
MGEEASTIIKAGAGWGKWLCSHPGHFNPETIFQCSLNRRLCGTQSRCGPLVKETNFFLLWGIESWY